MTLTQVDLNRLKSFYYVYKSCSPTAAAKQLNVTPSAVNQAVKKLESEMNSRLFVRSGKSYIPTAQARELFTLVEEHFQGLMKFVSENATSGQGQPKGNLRIGAVINFSRLYLFPIIRDFSQTYPHVKFDMMLTGPPRTMPRLLEGDLDFVIADDGPYMKSYPNIMKQPLCEEDLVMVCSPQLYRRFKRQIDEKERLHELPHVLYTTECIATHKWYLHHFRTTPSFKNQLVIDNVFSIADAVANDLGLAMLPASIAQPRILAGQFIKIQVQDTEAVNRIDIIHLGGHVPTRAEKLFIRFLRERVPSRIEG